MHTKLHAAVTDANGRPLSFFMTAGQVSDYTGAAALLDDLPKAQWLLGDRGYDADWFRDALQAKGIQPCIPGRKSRLEPVRYDKRRYRRRSRIEIMFGRLRDWCRVATRYDRLLRRPPFLRLGRACRCVGGVTDHRKLGLGGRRPISTVRTGSHLSDSTRILDRSFV